MQREGIGHPHQVRVGGGERLGRHQRGLNGGHAVEERDLVEHRDALILALYGRKLIGEPARIAHQYDVGSDLAACHFERRLADRGRIVLVGLVLLAVAIVALGIVVRAVRWAGKGHGGSGGDEPHRDLGRRQVAGPVCNLDT